MAVNSVRTRRASYLGESKGVGSALGFGTTWLVAFRSLSGENRGPGYVAVSGGVLGTPGPAHIRGSFVSWLPSSWQPEPGYLGGAAPWEWESWKLVDTVSQRCPWL